LLERVRQAKADLEPGKRSNLTDAEARLMKSRSGYLAGYNAQAVVSALEEAVAGTTGRLITAADVTDDPDDHSQLVPMIAQAAEATGAPATVTEADAGYHSGPNLAALAEQRIVMPEASARAQEQPYHKDRFTYDAEQDTYTCPDGQVLTLRTTRQDESREYRGKGTVCRACPAFGVCTTNQRQGRTLEVGPHEAVIQAHRTWMATEEAQELYRQRKELVEPVFGLLKEGQGARRFLLRGLAQVQAEWRLLAATFNLKTLARVWQAQPERVLGGQAAA
jgi:hypothetical protein